jgi:glycosyltransferase involved in cell wall biosynthesis
MESSVLTDIDAILERLRTKHKVEGCAQPEDVAEMEEILKRVSIDSSMKPEGVAELGRLLSELVPNQPKVLPDGAVLQHSNKAHTVIKPLEPLKKCPIDKICVIGHPSRYGGADVELDHQIRLWQKLGIKVHILHTGAIDTGLKSMNMEARGCVVHTPEKWHKCRDMVTISYCNDKFLKNLEAIHKFARKTIWVNCMCYLFDDEKKAHEKGLIDWFVYQTNHVRDRVTPELTRINSNYNAYTLRPYFFKDDYKFRNDRPTDKFRFGRVSRADADKFHAKTLWIYETMLAPVLKQGYILGFNDKVQAKIGIPPNWIQCFDAGVVPPRTIYELVDCIITANGNYENLPRVAFEAMASGCLLIADNNGGWKEQIQHGRTGWLCNDEKEFAYYATRSAYEVRERREMVQNAYDWLNAEWGEEQAMRDWTDFFIKVVEE